MQKPDVKISVSLPRILADALTGIAEAFDLTTGAVVREALTQFLKNVENDYSGTNAENNKLPDQDLRNDAYKKIFVYAVNSSKNWNQLQSKLAQDSLEIAPKGGGLVLRIANTNQDICKASEAGFGYSSLIKKFKSGFPGHNHQWLAIRVLAEERH